MVVYDLDTIWSGLSPNETHAPLVVDADAELARPIAPEGFEAIARRRAQRLQGRRRVQHVQFSRRGLGDGAPSGRAIAVCEKPLSFGVGEANDHTSRYTIRIAYCPAATIGRAYELRSASNCATWARSSGTPSPVWAEVKNTSG